MKPFTLKIDGESWRVVFRKPAKGSRGLCVYENRTIRINRGMSFEDTRATLCHEILHARYFDLDEAAILSGEDALEQGLKGLDKVWK